MLALRGLLPWLTLLCVAPAAAFTYQPSMRGQVSYVKLERQADGRWQSIAITPDARDPSAWLAPDYPSTNLCREAGAAIERPDCRSYAIYIPNRYSGSALPLHLSLHGNGGFAEAQIGDIPKNDGTETTAADNSGLEGRYNQLAEQHGFAVIYPNGSINGQGTTVNGRDWNDCRISEPNSTADDVAYIARVLDDVEASLRVDTRRIYAHGYSNGAMMVLRLYAELGERFTAFATTAGNQPRDDQTECAPPTVKKPLFMVFGDLDAVVPYTGAGVRVSMRSADDTIAYWTRYLGTEKPTSDDLLWMQNWAPVANVNSTDGVPDSRGYLRLYAGGAEGSQGVGPTPLLVKKIHQGGHSMSGSSQITNATGQATLGPKNLDIQLADELVAFFSQFAMAPTMDAPARKENIAGFGMTGGSAGAWLLPLALVALRCRRQCLLPLVALALAACGDSSRPVTNLPPVTGGSDVLVCAPITLPTVQGAGSAIDGPPPAYDWQGEWQSCEVIFPSKLHGSALYGVLFAPKKLNLARDRLPTVVIAPGSATGLQAQYHWSARAMAGEGYIALTVDPQGVGRSEAVSQPQTADNYIDAIVSALDYLESPQNPLQKNVDSRRIGAAGHSLSARVLSFVQGQESRLQAIVAWDNLSSTVEGDAGISSGGGTCGSLIGGELPLSSRPATPRVPAMGQASDAEPGCDPTNDDPEIKKTAYEVWRRAGVSSMQIVVQGKGHADWAQAPTADAASDSPKSKELQLLHHYTRAWFDLWLKQDQRAIRALTASQVLENTRDTIYSVDFRSALYLPVAGIDCPDIVTGNCPAFAP